MQYSEAIKIIEDELPVTEVGACACYIDSKYNNAWSKTQHTFESRGCKIEDLDQFVEDQVGMIKLYKHENGISDERAFLESKKLQERLKNGE